MADEGFSVRHSAARLDLTERAAAARLRIVFASWESEIDTSFTPKIGLAEWQRALGSIRAFIEVHGHSEGSRVLPGRRGHAAGMLVGSIRTRPTPAAIGSGEGPRPKGSDFFPGVTTKLSWIGSRAGRGRTR
jgi:hypothetical protein